MTTTDDSRATYLTEQQAGMRADAPPVIPPCPSWCVSTAKLHPLDFDRVDGMYVRTHEAFVGAIVTVEATERSEGQGGTVTLSAPEIRLFGADYDGRTVTPAEALVLEAEMRKARHVLDQLTASTTVPPCPSWCARPAGHPYSDAAHKYNGSPVFERVHSAHPEGEVFADVVTTEHYLRGEVHVDLPVASVTVHSGDGWYSEGLRELADDMLKTADLLDQITGEAQTAPVRDDRGQVAGLDGHEPQNPVARRRQRP